VSTELRALAALLAATILPACAREARPGAPGRPNRFSVALQQDFGIVSAQDACSKESQLTRGLACFRSNETQYHGTPLLGVGAAHGGLTPATTRLLFGFDRMLFERWALGLRGGFVFAGGGPRPDGASAHAFLPFHGEARMTYWFGVPPGRGPGLRGGVFVGGGLAQVDTAWSVHVDEDTSVRPSAAQPSNPLAQTLTVYQKAGTGFVSGGAAVAFALDQASAFFLDVKLMQLFPSSGTVVAPEIGYEYGF
jgi:hypothetical protein